MNATVIILSLLFVLFYTLLATWSANNYKRSTKKEYEEKLEKASLRSLAQGVQIQEMNDLNDSLKAGIGKLHDEIDGLNDKIQNTGVFRNAKGQFQRIRP